MTENFRCVKTGLASLLWDPGEVLPVLEDAVRRTHAIVTHGLLFLKLFLLARPEAVLTDFRTLVELCFKVVSVRDRPRAFKANAALWAELSSFYDREYRPLLPPEFSPLRSSGLKQVLKYETAKVVTAYETNFTYHYGDYVRDLVTVLGFREEYREEVGAGRRSKEEFWQYQRTLQKVERDLQTVDHSRWKSSPDDHASLAQVQFQLLPASVLADRAKVLRYHLKATPTAFLSPLLAVTTFLEEEERRLRNLFPLRTDLTPKHIRIDTEVLRELFPAYRKLQKVELWSRFFRTDRKLFQRNFHFMVETDGVACTILRSEKSAQGSRSLSDEPYLEDLTPSQCSCLRTRKVVAIDPGMSDLLSCVSEVSTASTPEKFRYTQNQRRRDLQTVSKRRQLEHEKRTTVLAGRTVKEWETSLSLYNSKTVNHEKFREYIRQKLLISAVLAPFYEQRHYRKDRFSRYIRTQRSERQCLNAFRAKFGAPEEALVAFGDWSQYEHRQHHEPVKGKGFRNLFRRNGYTTVLVDEYRTSKQCSCCRTPEARCKEFHYRQHPNTKKPLEQRSSQKVRGLLKCSTCSRLWNRDINAPLNLCLIAREHLEGRARPAYLRRGENSHRNVTSGTVIAVSQK